MRHISFIIVAGGTGKRMNSQIPKQFLLLRNAPIMMYTIANAYNALSSYKLRIILVLNSDFIDYWHDLKKHYNFSIPTIEVNGGKERFHSVRNGLNLAFDEGLIAVHDSVRPFINKKIIEQGISLAEDKNSAIPYVKPTNSLRIENEDGTNQALDRSKIRVIQTPQFFNSRLIKQAYQQPYQKKFTDDASVYEAQGNQVFLFYGSEDNIKITTQADLILAEYLAKKNKMKLAW